MRALRGRLVPLALTLGVVAPGAGCAVGPDYERPGVKVPGTFGSDSRPGFARDAVEASWWHGLGDPLLEELIGRAAVSNLDLQVAASRIRQARALRTRSMLELAPIVHGRADYTREELGQPVLPRFGYPDRNFEFYEGAFDATWELDVFGRLRRAVEANGAEIEAAESARRDVLVTLCAEVARSYVELRGAQSELDVARRNAETQRKTADLAIARVKGGRGTDFDVARAEAQYHTTRATIPGLEARIAQSIHRVGVLLGEQPTVLFERLAPTKSLPETPARIAIGDPASLLQRRPDVRQAEALLHASMARIGVAKADLFPRLSLNGSLGLQVHRLSKVGDPGQEIWSFGPHLSWAAFDIGRVLASVEAADEEAKQAGFRFQETVLVALVETENALVSFDSARARRDALRDATKESERAAALARQRFEDGVTDFLSVLEAELRLLEAQQALAASETGTATSLVSLYKVLAGGWQTFETDETRAK